MYWPVIIAGFSLGAAGNLHCIGMCGPLSLALPVNGLNATARYFSLLMYQAGRVITYSCLGLLFGLSGRRLYISGFQQGYSVIAGLLVLSFALLYFTRHRFIHIGFLSPFFMRVQQLTGRLLRKASGPAGFLLTGMANGLLPCGMVYVALLSVLSFTSVTESILFMAMFGAGTVPAMMAVACAGRLLKPAARFRLQQAVPYFITLMGVLLILRGMNLGIPFVSPALPASPGQALVCHPS